MRSTRQPPDLSRSVVNANFERADATDLFVRSQQHGDSVAREELARRYLPLARKLARRYVGAREPIDDLVQVASLGLVKAIDRFDAERGISFSSFAVPTILGELKRYFRDFGWSVHVPRGAQEMALKVGKAADELSAKTGMFPRVAELAEYLEWSVEDVVNALETSEAHHATSLDAPADDGEVESATLGDSLGRVDPRLESADARVTLAAGARALTSRERRVLRLRFVEDRTQSEIAGVIGVSQMQVSRILRRVLAQLEGWTMQPGRPGVPGS